MQSDLNTIAVIRHRFYAKCIHFHMYYDYKIVIELAVGKVPSLYDYILRVPMPGNENRVKFIGIVPINGNALLGHQKGLKWRKKCIFGIFIFIMFELLRTVKFSVQNYWCRNSMILHILYMTRIQQYFCIENCALSNLKFSAFK